MYIGLMGITDNGTLVTPGGKLLFRVPFKLACIIQRIQHMVSVWARKREVEKELKREQYLLDHISDDDLPLYINEKWVFETSEEQYLERLKNVHR